MQNSNTKWKGYLCSAKSNISECNGFINLTGNNLTVNNLQCNLNANHFQVNINGYNRNRISNKEQAKQLLTAMYLRPQLIYQILKHCLIRSQQLPKNAAAKVWQVRLIQ